MSDWPDFTLYCAFTQKIGNLEIALNLRLHCILFIGSMTRFCNHCRKIFHQKMSFLDIDLIFSAPLSNKIFFWHQMIAWIHCRNIGHWKIRLPSQILKYCSKEENYYGRQQFIVQLKTKHLRKQAQLCVE